LTVARPEEPARYQHLAASALEALVHAMEAKDPHLPGHSLRVAELAASIAARMGRADWEVEEVRLAGRLHDLGMIAIGDAILTKAGALSAREYAEVKRHPVLGYDILSGYPNLERVAAYVRGHHERWDGAGYPDGLADESIPWGAQILAAAEVFDAMTSSRAYRAANSVSAALERMYAQSSDFIDPSVMRTLTRVVSKRETLSFIRDDDTLRVERDLLMRRDATDGSGNGTRG
jgi:HD-GYP domain-containing protein (c-di-GMP phosphodiesterase class II)